MYREYKDTLIDTIDKVTATTKDGFVTTEYEQIVGQLVALFSDIKENGKYVFFIGNGGSAAIAGHMDSAAIGDAVGCGKATYKLTTFADLLKAVEE